jgi:hypothetical protein
VGGEIRTLFGVGHLGFALGVPTSLVPLPPSSTGLQAGPSRHRHAAAPGAAGQPAPTAPAAAQKPVVHFAVSRDLGELAQQFNCLLHLVAEATARGAPRP